MLLPLSSPIALVPMKIGPPLSPPRHPGPATAIGLLKGSSYRGDRSCGFYYYMSLDYLPQGWRLVTAP